MTLGDIIKRYRDDRTMSMDSFAQLSGLSKSYISVLERNKTPHGNKPAPGIDTYRAVAKALGIDVNELIRAVDDDIELSTTLPRNLFPARFNQKPLIGNIACGTPILAEENITDYIDVPEHIHCDFALKCQGRSMINLGVQDGDIVYIRSQPEVQNGQIAAVIIDGVESEATLKKFYRYDNQIVLIPANDDDTPFVYAGEGMARVHVQGLAVGFMHVF